MTAAATTGPARLPLPTSSHPASTISGLKEDRSIHKLNTEIEPTKKNSIVLNFDSRIKGNHHHYGKRRTNEFVENTIQGRHLRKSMDQTGRTPGDQSGRWQGHLWKSAL